MSKEEILKQLEKSLDIATKSNNEKLCEQIKAKIKSIKNNTSILKTENNG